MNQVAISGRISRDIEVQTTQNGVKFIKNAIAVKKDFGDGADFIPIVLWRNQAEYLEKYGDKGSVVIATGRLTISTYEVKGEKRSSAEINVTNIELIQPKQQVQIDTSKEAALERQQEALKEAESAVQEVPWDLEL